MDRSLVPADCEHFGKRRSPSVDSPLFKFRQLLQLWVESQKYGMVIKPEDWDGNDPHDVLARLLGTRELFAAFVDTKGLQDIILGDKDFHGEELGNQLRVLLRRPNRRALP